MFSSTSSKALFLLRIPRAWQSTNSYVLLNLRDQFQGYHCYHGLSYISRQSVSKGICCPMGWNKKRNPVIPVWRAIGTQPTSNEDCSMESIMAESENISSIEQGQYEKHVVSEVRKLADSTIPSSSLQAENEVGEAEGVQVGPGSTSASGLKFAEGVLGDCMSASASQNITGVAHEEKVSVVYKKKHAVSVEVGASVMRFIRGKDGSVQKGIEEDLGVKLKFPSSKQEDSIVIEGDCMDLIAKASEKIQAIIDEASNSSALNYSHFVSLPLALHTELVDKLIRFQSTVLGDSDSKVADGTTNASDETSEDEEISDKPEKAPEVAVKLKVDDTNNVKVGVMSIPLVSYAPKASRSPTSSGLGIDKSIFIKPKTFHLTVLMLKLWNKERILAAKDVLQSISCELIEVLDNRPLYVRLKGLDCLRGSRAKAQVLYAPVEEIGNEGRLLRACQIIADAYVKAGLVLEKDAKQKLKLHATVMNTTHRKRGRGINTRRRDTFDARGILEQYGSELWGDYHIREAHLSQRFLYDENGYYHCCASIPFPEISEVPVTSDTQVEPVQVSIAESESVCLS